jgi:2-dehydro-3-deoxyphosphogluconate aldolase / (4S)-4-hydroxy-2-oxoglutarate aldolase
VSEDFSSVLRRERLVAIVREGARERALEIASALIDGGVRVLEFSMSERASLDALSALAERYGDEITIGAGTVLTRSDAEAACERGARFLVSPILDETLVAWAASKQIALVPGALSPSELSRAHQAGATVIKLFPAALHGPGYVRDVLVPLPRLQLLPTGGVTVEDAAAYIRAGALAVALGSALTSGANGDVLAGRASTLLATLKETRSSAGAL